MHPQIADRRQWWLFVDASANEVTGTVGGAPEETMPRPTLELYQAMRLLQGEAPVPDAVCRQSTNCACGCSTCPGLATCAALMERPLRQAYCYMDAEVMAAIDLAAGFDPTHLHSFGGTLLRQSVQVFGVCSSGSVCLCAVRQAVCQGWCQVLLCEVYGALWYALARR